MLAGVADKPVPPAAARLVQVVPLGVRVVPLAAWAVAPAATPRHCTATTPQVVRPDRPLAGPVRVVPAWVVGAQVGSDQMARRHSTATVRVRGAQAARPATAAARALAVRAPRVPAPVGPTERTGLARAPQVGGAQAPAVMRWLALVAPAEAVMHWAASRVVTALALAQAAAGRAAASLGRVATTMP